MSRSRSPTSSASAGPRRRAHAGGLRRRSAELRARVGSCASRRLGSSAAAAKERDARPTRRRDRDVEEAIQGVLIETAEKIADEISERMDVIIGLRAMIGARAVSSPRSRRRRRCDFAA